MNYQEFLEFTEDQRIAVCGFKRQVDDFIYIFKDIISANFCKIYIRDKKSILNCILNDYNRLIFCEDIEKEVEEKCIDTNKKFISMYDCFGILDEINVGFWNYGSHADSSKKILPFDRKIALWGANNASAFFIDSQKNIKVECIIDNNMKINGTLLNNIKVFHPDFVDQMQNYYILIMCKDKYSVREQLEKKGLKEFEDFTYYNFYGPCNLSPSEMMKKTIQDTSLNVKCFNPFYYSFWSVSGDIWYCCYAGDVSMGNVLKDGFQNVWNSLFAKLIRLSVVNQTYSFCDSYACPYDLRKENKFIGDIDNKNYIMTCPTYPKALSISHDGSCNLYCESCRDKGYVISGKELVRAQNISKQLTDILPYAEEILLAGGGEIFVSKIYRKIMENFFACKVKNQTIIILTNGKLFNMTNWVRIYHAHKDKIMYLGVSIDAATKNTYERLRRGGDWNVLMENLHFASTLRREGKLSNFTLLFVIQSKNVEETIMFVELGKRLNADCIMFSAIGNWGTYSKGEFEKISILDEDGFVKKEYENIFSNPIMQDEIVDLGNIRIRDNYKLADGYLNKVSKRSINFPFVMWKDGNQ